MCKPLFLIPFLLVSLQVLAQTPAPPKPTALISFERQAIRENDCVPIETWLSNDDKHELSDVTLQIALPSFLKLDENPCGSEDRNVIQPIKLEAEQPPFVFHRKLYLKTGPDITVGDYSLLFTFTYQWKLEKAQGRAALGVEKPVKANFLGSESVAGVPLGLAGLIVPGLFFWLVIRMLGVPWGVETALGDKLIYSVVISFIFVALASILITYASWLHYLDVSSGMSVTKLIWLAGTGIVIGIVVGVFERFRRKKRAKREAQARINFDDDDAAIMEKLLKRNSAYNPSVLVRLFRRRQQIAEDRPETVVRLTNGDEFIGSLGVREADLTTLAGWFNVKKSEANPKLNKQLEDLLGKDCLYDAMVSARKANLTISELNNVQKRAAGEAIPTSTAGLTSRWPSDAVLQVIVKTGNPNAKPLVSLI